MKHCRPLRILSLICCLFLLMLPVSVPAESTAAPTYRISESGMSSQARLLILSEGGIESDTNAEFINLSQPLCFSGVLDLSGNPYTAFTYTSSNATEVTRYLDAGAVIELSGNSFAEIRCEGTFTGTLSLSDCTVKNLYLDGGTFLMEDGTLAGTVELRGVPEIHFDNCVMLDGASLARSTTPVIYVDGEQV